MEDSRIEQVNIEKCKELFAYEMTEVLLMLKGEFAAVSGSELGYSQYHVSEEKRNAPMAVIQREQMPGIQIRPAHIAVDMGTDIAEIITSVEEGNAKQEIAVEHPCLLLPKLGIPKILDKEQEMDVHCAVSVPRISVNVPSNISAPSYSLPKVPLPELKNLPEITIPQLSVECSKTVVPVAAATVVRIPEVEHTQIRIDLPEIRSQAAIRLPAAQRGVTVLPTEAEQKTWETARIPEIPAVSIPAVTLTYMEINIPGINTIWP